MIHISREEILKLAHMSRIEIHSNEIEQVMGHLQQILDYAARVSEVAEDVYEPSNKNINVVREDVILQTDPEPILSQAPEREENFFVVPSIIKSN